LKIAFLGCGAAGRVLGLAWRRAGHELGAVRTRSRASALESIAVLGGGDADASLLDADVVVFATPDDALAAAAEEHDLRPEQVALHLSGALPSTVLAPTGARPASLHPLRAFADVDGALAALPDTACFVEGEAVETAEALARDLTARVARIDTARKALYHAAAAIASNYTLALVAWALDLFREAGVGEDVARDALLPLARGSLDNIAVLGLPDALTGPVARGDVGLVARHLDALPPDQRRRYAELVRATLPLARAKGGLSDDAATAIERLLDGVR